VLPVVILAMVVVAATAAVMLQRSVTVSYAVTRQIDAYRVQHGVRGLQEAVEAWLSQQRARTLPDVIDEDGFAIELIPGDGTRVALYFFDGQGTARANSLGVPEDVAPDVEAVAQEVEREYGIDRARRFLREVGPYQISINAAAPELLLALADALAPSDRRQELRDRLAQVAELRERESIGQEGITSLVNAARLGGADRTRIVRILTPQPVLWEVVIVVRGDGVRAPLGELARYRTLVLVEPADATGGAFEQPSAFLAWDELKRDDPRFAEDRYWEIGR